MLEKQIHSENINELYSFKFDFQDSEINRI